MEEKALIRMLILFLGFSYVLSSAAVPLSRIFKSINANPSAQELMAQGTMGLRSDGELFEMEEGFIHGRMDIQTTDYHTGPNHDHDPKTPNRS